MILTDGETIRVIKGDNRRFRASVVFSFLSIKSPTAIKIKAPNAQDGSVTDKIVFPYLSHIKNRFFIGDEFSAKAKNIPGVSDEHNRVFPKILNRYGGAPDFVQVEKAETSHVGYIGAMADARGNVRDEITEWIPLTDIENITLRTNPDRCIKDATIEIFANNQTDEAVAKIEIQNNTRDFLLLNLPCKNATHLKLTITKAAPNKRIWLVSFFAGFEYALDESQIVKIKYQQKKSENKEGSIGRLYLNSIDLTLSNIDRIFDKENSLSPIVSYLTTAAMFSVMLSLQQGAMQKPLSLDLGTFAVTEFTSKLSEASAVIKGADFIGSQKEKEIALGILENQSAYDAFKAIALKLSLEPTGIDENLKKVKYALCPLNGGAAKILNKLCADSASFCTTRGNVLVATLLKSKHAQLRYPQRYFALDEFKESNSQKANALIPNVVNLSYSTYEYENGVFAKKKFVLDYNRDIKKQEKKWETLPLPDYINDIFVPADPTTKPASYTRVFTSLEIPENFHHVEISDDFLYKVFEYKINVQKKAGDAKPEKITVTIWSYEEHDDTEQCTIMLCVKEKPASSIIDSQDFTVYSHADEYVRSSELALSPNDKNDAAEIERRNMPNNPEVFSVETSGDVQIERIEVGNYFTKGVFEFYLTKTETGCTVRAWNYSAVPQTLSINVYGCRLEKSEQKITISARDEKNIKINGEIVKNVSVEGVSDRDAAEEILQTSMNYYKEFTGAISVEAWSDPRVQLYDFLAFKKLRYPQYSQGIVDEITLEYNGALTQKINISETEKHNRDCRVFDWFVSSDRVLLFGNETSAI